MAPLTSNSLLALQRIRDYHASGRQASALIDIVTAFASNPFLGFYQFSIFRENMASSLPPGIDPAMIPAMQPPPGIVPNFVDPVTLADPIVAVSATTSVLALILLSVRLYSTLKITRSASYDDGAVVLAMVFTLAYIGLSSSIKDDTRHGWDLPIAAFTARYLKIILWQAIVAALGFLFAKLSILLLLFRLFSPTRRFRYLVFGGIAWTAIISLTSVLVAPSLCAPRMGESYTSMAVARRCGHEGVWAVVQGVLNVCLDFYILYLPIPMVWKLQMDRQRRIGVMAIFMTGFVACIASVACLAFKVELFRSSDTLWNAGRVNILNIVEVNVAIMVACMPACASIARHFSAKFGIVTSIKSRFVTSEKQDLKPFNTITDANAVSCTAGARSGRSERGPWNVKHDYTNNDIESAPPQIPTDNRYGGLFDSGDFSAFDNDKYAGSSSSQDEKSASIVQATSSLEMQRTPQATALHHIV